MSLTPFSVQGAAYSASPPQEERSETVVSESVYVFGYMYSKAGLCNSDAICGTKQTKEFSQAHPPIVEPVLSNVSPLKQSSFESATGSA